VDKDSYSLPPQLIGRSPKMLKVFKDLKRVAPKDLAVLLTGEHGTHKELIAHAIHVHSMRSKNPFIIARLTSVPKDSIAAELLGHEKRTSKGTTERKIGKIEAANKGTLFIDEISALDIKIQENLLRFIHEKEFRPIDSNKSYKSDVRVIAATTSNLKDALAKEQILGDLYDVLKTVQIRVPSLRERKEDILPLAQYLLNESAEKFETGQKEFSKDARSFLLKHDWPGNIRELENTIKKATVLSNGSVLRKKDLLLDNIGAYSIREFLEEKLRRYLKAMKKLDNCYLYETVLGEVEKSLFTIVLNETEGNQLKAAKVLGINRNTLRSKIKEYKIRIT
jgi:two-component system nitrogen regulation response regulator GlnG